ncbi:Fasciclin-like arabinogalactan protein 17 [Forsythia ovata]|uniref:Fasciclin-like arabinogalactan protein 17 n=1 Tax=Forsythia ovata TaxID=205694 RepID=A0ABD1WQD2_9LAMI
MSCVQVQITIFVPRNEDLEWDVDPDFKHFLLELRNLKCLQNLLLFHIIPTRIESKHCLVEVNKPTYYTNLCRDAYDEKVRVIEENGEKPLGKVRIIKGDDIIRPNGIICDTERLLVPKYVQQDFNTRRSLRSISILLSDEAPEFKKCKR